MVVWLRDLLAIIIFFNLIIALQDSVKVFELRNGNIHLPGVAEYSPRFPNYFPSTRISRQAKGSSLSSIRQWTQPVPITDRSTNAKVITNFDAKNDKNYITITPTQIKDRKRALGSEETTGYVTNAATKVQETNLIEGDEIASNDEIKIKIATNAAASTVIFVSRISSTLPPPTTLLPHTKGDQLERSKITSSIIFDSFSPHLKSNKSSTNRTTLASSTATSSVVADSSSSPFTSPTPPTKLVFADPTDHKNSLNKSDSTTTSLITNSTSSQNTTSSTPSTMLLYTDPPGQKNILNITNSTTRNFENQENVTEVPRDIQISVYRLPDNGYLILLLGCAGPVVLATIVLLIVGCRRKYSSRRNSSSHLQSPLMNLRARRFT